MCIEQLKRGVLPNPPNPPCIRACLHFGQTQPASLESTSAASFDPAACTVSTGILACSTVCCGGVVARASSVRTIRAFRIYEGHEDFMSW